MVESIGRGKREHLEQLLTLHNIGYEFDQWDYDRFEQIIKYELPIITIEVDGQIVASLIYLTCLDELRIIDLVVHPAYRNYGYAKKLLYAAIVDAREQSLRYVLLDVRVGNFKAINLYTKIGFRVITIRNSFYNYNEYVEDSYLMQLVL